MKCNKKVGNSIILMHFRAVVKKDKKDHTIIDSENSLSKHKDLIV